ncbi:MAG: hypothetical protein HYU74_07595 [Dechloromonas sp.]|nr:hypothetical protein [Dechloromonas sp.]
MLDVILDNRLLLGAVVFLLLLMVPVLIISGHKLRDPSHHDRRKKARADVDRRA